MELFGNTFFWLFFFMIGFVATLELIEDLGAAYATKVIHRTVQTAWLVVGYVLIIILFECCGCSGPHTRGRPMRYEMGRLFISAPSSKIGTHF